MAQVDVLEQKLETTTPIEEDIRLHINMEAKFVDITKYQSLIRNLIYLTYN
uniref:Uncharacterized protein n=1 Tax=Physcomitrium patens TaxID=3218 RepID=A0A2K1KAT0_PHYPA|nr:hypothetical protein PHYPA_010074 [Physcomitrium patens]